MRASVKSDKSPASCRKFQPFDLEKGFLENLLMAETCWEFEHRCALRPNQFSRDRQELVANGHKRSTSERLGKTKALEPVQKIVSETDEMKISDIGFPDSGGDFPQCIGFFEFPNHKLRLGPVVVETPQPVRGQRKICDDRLISESLHLEKRKLPARFFGNGTANDDKTLRRFPSLGLIAEFCRKGLSRNATEAKSTEPGLHRLGKFCHDRVESPSFLEKFDDLVVEEGVVGAHTNLANGGRNLGKGTFEKLACDACRMHIAGMKASFPDVLCDSLETQQGMIGRPSPFLGVVPYLGSFLPPVDGQYRRIQIENDPAWRAKHLSPQSFVKFEEGLQPSLGEPKKETPQGGGIGIMLESCQEPKHTVLLEDPCRLDSSQADQHGIEQRQNEFAGGVTVVPLVDLNGADQLPPQGEALEKMLDQEEATEMSKVFSGKRKSKISRAVGHKTDSLLKV